MIIKDDEKKKINKGHYCMEWDFKWITNKDMEFDSCTCFPKRTDEEINQENIVISELQNLYGIK